MKVSIDGSNFSWALNKVGFVSVFVSMLYIQEYFGILQENNIIYISELPTLKYFLGETGVGFGGKTQIF